MDIGSRVARAATAVADRVARLPVVRPLVAGAASRLRLQALLREDIVAYDVHRFEPTAWVLKDLGGGLRIWCSLDDRAISRPILVNAYDLAETAFVRATVRPGDLAIDAGANIGYYALLLASLVGPGGAVEAFEPLPYLADALEASVAENALAARLNVRRIALDERPGTLFLRHAPRTANFGGAHLTAASGGPPPAHADETVTTARLDDLIAGRRVAFLKIDVEGAEPRLVRGARATLAASRPVVLAELHERQLQLVSACGATAFIEQMAALGYGCSTLERDGTRGVSLERYDDERPLNVVFDPLAPTA